MKKLVCLALAGIILALSACVSSKPIEHTDESSAAVSEVSSAEVSSEVSSMPEQSEEETLPLIEVSADNEFIDFEYIENYEGITDREKVKELAEKCEMTVSQNDDYSNEFLEDFKKWHSKDYEEYIKYAEAHGEMKPAFKEAFINDFDGNGTEEAFVIVNPASTDLYELVSGGIPSFLVFVDSEGNAEVLNWFFYVHEVCMLNYGKNKQLIFYSSGNMGATDHDELYGVKNGKAVNLYGLRGQFYKYNCFLSAFGWQASGDLMYFDTVAEEYRVIVGDLLDINKVLAMDTTDALKQYKESPDDYAVYYIGNTYYCFCYPFMDSGIAFTYDNGEFTPASEYIRVSNPSYVGNNVVKNIDMAKAIATMKKPISSR